jgi:hypothetical protein
MPIRRDYRFRHYVNLDRTEPRLERLLKEFPFEPLASLAARFFPTAG